MLWPQYRWSLTIAILALAAAHWARNDCCRRVAARILGSRRIFYGGLALTFATLAIPIRCDGKWITIAWAVEGAILIWSGLAAKLPLMRWAGFLLFAIVTGRLVAISIPADTFLWNERFATFSVAVGCFFAACYFASKAGDAVGP